jgi:hypothetical protein
MAELETLITLLSSQFDGHPTLRDALIETTLAVIAGEERKGHDREADQSYLHVLKQIARQQRWQEQAKQPELSAALHKLSLQIQKDLQQTALALHQSLRSGHFQHDKTLAQRVGIELHEFPVGFPQEISLPDASKQYLNAVHDLAFLQQHFPKQLPQLTHKLEREKLRGAVHLQPLILEALSSQDLNAPELIRLYKRASALLEHQRIEAENELLTILEHYMDFLVLESVAELDSWLHTYHYQAFTVLKSLSPGKQTILRELLIRSHATVALEALTRLAPPPKEEHERFKTLMTLRFGEDFLRTKDRWKRWLQQQLDRVTQKPEAIDFWQEHLSVLPHILADQYPGLFKELD